jgi:hypothetical protein
LAATVFVVVVGVVVVGVVLVEEPHAAATRATPSVAAERERYLRRRVILL